MEKSRIWRIPTELTHFSSVSFHSLWLNLNIEFHVWSQKLVYLASYIDILQTVLNNTVRVKLKIDGSKFIILGYDMYIEYYPLKIILLNRIY